MSILIRLLFKTSIGFVLLFSISSTLGAQNFQIGGLESLSIEESGGSSKSEYYMENNGGQSNSNARWSIDAPYSDYFEIVVIEGGNNTANTGSRIRLNTTNQADFESINPNPFTITLRATRGNSNNSQTAILDIEITLTDVDEQQPTITASGPFSYAEGQSEGVSLGAVQATDNEGVTGYEIIGGNDSGWFQIDGQGNISMTAAGVSSAANDAETGATSFTLAVQVSDAAGNTTQNDVTMNLTNVPESNLTGTQNTTTT